MTWRVVDSVTVELEEDELGVLGAMPPDSLVHAWRQHRAQAARAAAHLQQQRKQPLQQPAAAAADDAQPQAPGAQLLRQPSEAAPPPTPMESDKQLTQAAGYGLFTLRSLTLYVQYVQRMRVSAYPYVCACAR